MSLCYYIGDSIALLLHAFDPQCTVAAKIGASPAYIAEHFERKSGEEYTILSIGTNQPKAPDAMRQMVHLRTGITSRVIWILPYDRVAAARVKAIANASHDLTIDLAPFPTADKIHPTPASARQVSSLIRYATDALRGQNGADQPLPH